MQAESTFTSPILSRVCGDQKMRSKHGIELVTGEKGHRVMSENDTHRAPDNVLRTQSQCNKKFTIKGRNYLKDVIL